MTNATVNADQTVICVKVANTDVRYCDACAGRSSHRHKRCPVSQNFTPSAKIYVDAAGSHCVWLTFGRSTLQASFPQNNISTFDSCCGKHVRWKFASEYIMQHLISNCCSIVVDGSFFPNRQWHISVFWFVVSDSMIIGAGDFITSSTADYRSAHAAC